MRLRQSGCLAARHSSLPVPAPPKQQTARWGTPFAQHELQYHESVRHLANSLLCLTLPFQDAILNHSSFYIFYCMIIPKK